MAGVKLWAGRFTDGISAVPYESTVPRGPRSQIEIEMSYHSWRDFGNGRLKSKSSLMAITTDKSVGYSRQVEPLSITAFCGLWVGDQTQRWRTPLNGRSAVKLDYNVDTTQLV